MRTHNHNHSVATSPTSRNLSTLQPSQNKNKITQIDGRMIIESYLPHRSKKSGQFKPNILKQKIKQMENERLWRRLSEINNRKNKFQIESPENSQFLTINIKSREVYRRQKKKQLQEENDLFVERLVKRLNSHKSIFETSPEEKPIKKRRESKRKHQSFALPSVYKQ